MGARVKLEVIQGMLKGEEFVFEERTTCVMGRAKDCSPRIHAPKEKRTVSRHHCLLDINPPDIRIRDFGSLNGTIVNDRVIGQRAPNEPPGGASWIENHEFDLSDGDKIRLGDTVLRVCIFAPTLRENALQDPAERRHTQIEERTENHAPASRERRAEAIPSTVIRQSSAKACPKCGRDVSDEVSENRDGEYVCAACRSDPLELMKVLLQDASTGDRDLVAIKGYELVRELGRGGMGAVFLARQEQDSVEVALKVMLPKVVATPRATDSFLRETHNTKALHHPNVVRLHDSGCSHGTFFFTLEFCDAGSVAKLMKCRGGKLSIDEAGPIILHALDGVAYAHSVVIPYVKLKDGNIVEGRGLVHRDLKPGNIFLCGSGNSRVAKVGDYGLAKAFDLAGLSGHTYTGDVAGSPYYMPRQQVLNFRDAGPEVDVWALAATLYRMLTGHPARDFSKRKEGWDPWQIVLQTDPVPIHKWEPEVPKRLAKVIDHALRDKPDIGFQTAAELKQALEQVL